MAQSIDVRLTTLLPLKNIQSKDGTKENFDKITAAVAETNNLSTPYFDHLMILRKQIIDYQCRINNLLLRYYY